MNRILPAVLAGLGIAYARGDFTKAGLAAIGVIDLAKMTLLVCAFGLAAVIIVKSFDRLLGHGRRSRSIAPANIALRPRSTDLGSRTAQRRANR